LAKQPLPVQVGRIDLWAWPMRAAEDARGSKILFITCSLVGHCRKGKPPKNGDGAELARFQPFHHHFPLVFYAPHVPTAFIKQTHTPTSHPYIYIYIYVYIIYEHPCKPLDHWELHWLWEFLIDIGFQPSIKVSSTR